MFTIFHVNVFYIASESGNPDNSNQNTSRRRRRRPRKNESLPEDSEDDPSGKAQLAPIDSKKLPDISRKTVDTDKPVSSRGDPIAASLRLSTVAANGTNDQNENIFESGRGPNVLNSDAFI